MMIIRNRVLPIGRRFSAINICGLLFVKQSAELTPELLTHERIHTRQMTELFIRTTPVILNGVEGLHNGATYKRRPDNNVKAPLLYVRQVSVFTFNLRSDELVAFAVYVYDLNRGIIFKMLAQLGDIHVH